MSWRRICFWYWTGPALRPDNELPVPPEPPEGPPGIWPEPPPVVGGGPIIPPIPGIWPPPPGINPRPPSLKPPGLPIIPIDPDYDVPTWPPHIWGGGGNWIPVDPGFGKPPVFGFLPADPGFGVPETPPPTPTPPIAGTLPGHWVPVDPGYGRPICGGSAPVVNPLWVWIPEIGPHFGVKKPKK